MERVEMENWRFLRGEDLTGVYDVGYAGLGGVYGRNRESCELSIIHSSFFFNKKDQLNGDNNNTSITILIDDQYNHELFSCRQIIDYSFP